MSAKRPPNDLTRDEWEDFRKAADTIDKVLEDLWTGRAQLDTRNYITVQHAVEVIQSTINIVIGQPGE